MRNSTILTNSEYIPKAILDTYGIGNAIVLSPPVDVDISRDVALSQHVCDDEKDDERDDVV
ncbi:MAG: hypothetical protein H0U27_13685 [Nitrosopumilus sp.]|nr:hypothetical protein [Nitrosopumilus sp.]